jgi:hypothetical protein
MNTIIYILLKAVVTTLRGKQHYNLFDGIAQRDRRKDR